MSEHKYVAVEDGRSDRYRIRDHSGGNAEFAKQFPGVKIYGGSKQCTGLTNQINHLDSFTIGKNIKVTGYHTPCHTQDSTCFFFEDKSKDQRGVFTGDTLYVDLKPYVNTFLPVNTAYLALWADAVVFSRAQQRRWTLHSTRRSAACLQILWYTTGTTTARATSNLPYTSVRNLPVPSSSARLTSVLSRPQQPGYQEAGRRYRRDWHHDRQIYHCR